MEEKRILIFEDEWPTIKGSFELANIYAFNGSLKFVQYSKSQDILFANWRDYYAAVFVDITLAKNTKYDGYNIVKEIKEKNLIDLRNVIVLTGNNKVKEKFKEMGFLDGEVQILYKPIAFDEIAKVLREII